MSRRISQVYEHVQRVLIYWERSNNRSNNRCLKASRNRKKSKIISVFSVRLSNNTILGLCSNSKKEKFNTCDLCNSYETSVWLNISFLKLSLQREIVKRNTCKKNVS